MKKILVFCLFALFPLLETQDANAQKDAGLHYGIQMGIEIWPHPVDVFLHRIPGSMFVEFDTKTVGIRGNLSYVYYMTNKTRSERIHFFNAESGWALMKSHSFELYCRCAKSVELGLWAGKRAVTVIDEQTLQWFGDTVKKTGRAPTIGYFNGVRPYISYNGIFRAEIYGPFFMKFTHRLTLPKPEVIGIFEYQTDNNWGKWDLGLYFEGLYRSPVPLGEIDHIDQYYPVIDSSIMRVVSGGRSTGLSLFVKFGRVIYPGFPIKGNSLKSPRIAGGLRIRYAQ